MVRINLIHPRYLADQHLLAEHNEIQMLMTWMLKYPKSKETDLKEYTLGKGHITFFRNKNEYILYRFSAVSAECEKRKFKINIRKNTEIFIENTINNFNITNAWYPSYEDIQKNYSRIIDKLNMKPEWYRYYGKNKDIKFWLNILYGYMILCRKNIIK